MRVHLHATPYLLPVPLNIDGSACELQFNVASLGFSSKFNCFNLRNTRRHQQPLGNPSNSTLNPLPLPTYSLYTQAHIHVYWHTASHCIVDPFVLSFAHDQPSGDSQVGIYLLQSLCHFAQNGYAPKIHARRIFSAIC